MIQTKEQGRHKTITTLKKYHEVMEPGKEKEFFAKYQPYEVREIEGNALVNAGINVMWNLICGGGGTAFNNANSTLEVYITDAYVAGTLDGSFPTYGTDQKATWKASWTGATGDGPWSKWKVTNGAVDLNEKTEALGTKSGGTWTLEVSITLS